METGAQGQGVFARSRGLRSRSWCAALLASICLLFTACIPSSDTAGVASDLANLSGLEVVDSTQQKVGLSPAFAGGTTNYTADVGGAIANITIRPTAINASGNTTIRVQQPGGTTTPITSGQVSPALPVNFGTNSFTITVDAPGVTKAYVLVVTRGANANLNALSLSAGGLTPAFQPATTDYTAKTGFTTPTTTVTATLSDTSSTLTVNGQAANSGQATAPIPLNTGSTKIAIAVRSQDGQTKTYTVDVVRAGTSDLSKLEVQGHSVSPDFDPSDTRPYGAAVPFGEGSANIVPTAADTSATVTINGQSAKSGQKFPVSLSPGVNSYSIVVTGPSVAPKTYSLNITRAPASSNARLRSLSVNHGALEPSFSSDLTSYVVNVPSSTSSITVSAVQDDSAASLTINGGGSPQTVSLNPAGTPTIVSIVVLAQDGGTTRNYLITVNRTQSANNNLGSLTVSPGSLSPGFSPGTTSYSVNVGSSVNSVSISATPEDGSSSVSINGQGGTSRSVSLGDAGSTTPVSIVVTAPNGTQKTYSVAIAKGALGGNNNLASLSVSSGSLSPAFSASTLNYTVSVGSGVGSVTVDASAQDGGATVSINGQSTNSLAVSLGAPGASTTVSVLVTAPNGSQKAYSIVISRGQLAGNNNLGNLSVSSGSLSPGFSASTLNYTVSVGSNISSVVVTATAQDPGASVSITWPGGSGSSVTLGAAGSSTVVNVTVTAPNGSQKAYSIVISRAALAGNNNLGNLSVSPGSLSPGFSASTLNYTVSVGSNISSVAVTATAEDPGASVSITWPGGSGSSVTLGAAGSSTIVSITVTASNGSQKAYSIVISRGQLAGNNNLGNLSVSSGSLSPGFSASTLNYTVSVGSIISSVDVTATAEDPGASVSITWPGGSGSSVTLGAAGSSTVVNITVTAPNGSQKVYLVTISRDAGPPPPGP